MAYLETFIHELSMDSSFYDEEIGTQDELGWFCIFRGPIDVEELIKNDSSLAAVAEGLDDDEILNLQNCAGVILELTSDGSAWVDGFDDKDALDREWERVKDEYNDYYNNIEDD